jgi:hypothetical protein
MSKATFTEKLQSFTADKQAIFRASIAAGAVHVHVCRP